MAHDKHSCANRAKALLETPSLESVRYAALELRMSMEFLTYEKLRGYSNIVPPEVQAIWQPPQAIRTLLEFEPDADRSFSLRVGFKETPGVQPTKMHDLGSHSALSLRWLRKHYNKLGQMLHAPNSANAPEPSVESSIQYLQEVIQDLEAPLASTILSSTIREVWSTTCTQCGKSISANADAMRKGHAAVCFTQGCDTEYEAEKKADGSIIFRPILVHIACVHCNLDIALPPKKVDVGVRFKCPHCGRGHEVVGNEWLVKTDKT